jgi:hypothetical protein
MLERGPVPDFPVQALAELDEVHGPAIPRVFVARSATSFALGDVADFGRFVMTRQFWKLKTHKTIYLQGLERVKGIEPSSRFRKADDSNIRQ